MHHAHTPEIEITSETTVKGKWYLEDFVLTAIPSNWAEPSDPNRQRL